MDWTNPQVKVTEHFTVKDCLWLPSWEILHIPSAKEQENLTRTCEALEFVRYALGAKPTVVHCMIRPTAVNCPGSERHGQDYNAFVKGAKRSAHIPGLAVDFHIVGTECDLVRARLRPRLEEFEICMEDLPGSSWVHIDLLPPAAHGGARFFKP